MFKGTFAITAAIAAAVTSAAAAAPLKGKPPATGAACKPAVAVVLTGKLAAAGSATFPFSLSVNVTGGNHAASAYRKAAQPIAVTITSTTAINRAGDHNAAHLAAGDRVNIQARACKADTTSQTPPTLTAVRVTAHVTH